MPRKDSHAMGEPLVTLSGRLPLSVLARVDAYVESMRCATPGLNIGRSDAFRILLVEGLDAVSRSADVTDTVTDTSVLDPEQQRLILKQDFEALLERAHVFMQAERQAQPVTDTVTDTAVPELPLEECEDRPPARRVAVPRDEDIEDMPLVPTAAVVAKTVKNARPKAAAKRKAARTTKGTP